MILAIESSTDACSVALLLNEHNIVEKFTIAPQQHAQLILPMVQQVLAEAQLKLPDLSAIAFGCGPGSFTGIRIAVSIAQGLAFGADLPVIAISTLKCLAHRAYRLYQLPNTIAALDARMNEIYYAIYQFDKQSLALKQLVTDSLSNPTKIVIPKEGSWIGIGDGWQNFSRELHNKLQNQVLWTLPHFKPHAEDVARLALPELLSGNTLPPEQALPIYLRNNIANQENKGITK